MWAGLSVLAAIDADASQLEGECTKSPGRGWFERRARADTVVIFVHGILSMQLPRGKATVTPMLGKGFIGRNLCARIQRSIGLRYSSLSVLKT
jgi:hypothetical protein